MTKLIQMFATDPVQAKAFYYMSKLKQDVTTPEGTVFKRKMLMKYLEGLQWVLYYYERIDIQTLFQALYNVKFLEQIPLVSLHQVANADDIYVFST